MKTIEAIGIEVWEEAIARAKDLGLEVSATQPNTPGDGSCMFAACGDQMSHSASVLRLAVCANAEKMVKNGSLGWPGERTVTDWAHYMKEQSVYGDAVALHTIR